VKVSHKKGKCWATFLNDDPEHSCDGHGHFALNASIEEILEERRRNHARLDDVHQEAKKTVSPNREYGFSNLNVREQGGEKPSSASCQVNPSKQRELLIGNLESKLGGKSGN
jgi:hypothetical protein